MALRGPDPAAAAYDAIRASATDVDAIARNTGLRPTNVRKVKDHIFHAVHLLDRYAGLGVEPELRRFDPDPAIAAAWRRLEAGTFTPADVQLLRHEAAEAWYVRAHGPGYDAAHAAPQRRYPSPL